MADKETAPTNDERMDLTPEDAERVNRILELEAEMAQRQAELDALRNGASPESDSTEGEPQESEQEASQEIAETETVPRAIIYDDLEKIGAAIGTPADEEITIKLLLVHKFNNFMDKVRDVTDVEDNNTYLQRGPAQDVATAKRELEEAMYLYDNHFAQLEEQKRRALGKHRAKPTGERKRGELSHTDEENPMNRDRFRQISEQRRHRADGLRDKIDNIRQQLINTPEYTMFYEALSRGEVHFIPQEDRRRTDTKNWNGKPEYNDNGYPEFILEKNWQLEPKKPSVVEDSSGDKNSDPNVGEGGAEDDSSTGETNDEDGEDSSNGEGGEDGKGGEGGEDEPNTPEQAREAMEVANLDFHVYSELYARLKNLLGADKAAEMLKAESQHVRQQIGEHVYARMNNELMANPDMTPEQIRNFAQACYVEAVNQLQEEVCSAVDGEDVYDASGNLRRRGNVTRKFGAWMDRHGKTVKRVLLAAGLTGAAVVTGGIALGVIVPVFAVGTATAVGAGIGAVKGAGAGGILSRHGSKESSIRGIEEFALDDNEMNRLMAMLDANDQDTFRNIANHLMEHADQSGQYDHNTNVKKTRNAMVIGGAIGALGGALFGSMQLGANQSYNYETTVDHAATYHNVANTPLEIPHHTIQTGELTGQVIQNTLNQMGLGSQYNFVMPDGSTNMDLIYQLVPNWEASAGNTLGVHSFAGADSMSNEGIRTILEAIAQQAAGTQQEILTPAWTETLTHTGTQWVGNLPANIAAWISGGVLAGAAARQAAESTRGRWRGPETQGRDDDEAGGEQIPVQPEGGASGATAPGGSEATPPTPGSAETEPAGGDGSQQTPGSGERYQPRHAGRPNQPDTREDLPGLTEEERARLRENASRIRAARETEAPPPPTGEPWQPRSPGTPEAPPPPTGEQATPPRWNFFLGEILNQPPDIRQSWVDKGLITEHTDILGNQSYNLGPVGGNIYSRINAQATLSAGDQVNRLFEAFNTFVPEETEAPPPPTGEPWQPRSPGTPEAPPPPTGEPTIPGRVPRTPEAPPPSAN